MHIQVCMFVYVSVYINMNKQFTLEGLWSKVTKLATGKAKVRVHFSVLFVQFFP